MSHIFTHQLQSELKVLTILSKLSMIHRRWSFTVVSKETVVLHWWGVEKRCLVLSTECDVNKGNLAIVKRFES